MEIIRNAMSDCGVELSLNWMENFVLTAAEVGANADAIGADSVTLKITDAKLYVPVVTASPEDNVTVSPEDNVKLTKQLDKELKRSLYWNKRMQMMRNP